MSLLTPKTLVFLKYLFCCPGCADWLSHLLGCVRSEQTASEGIPCLCSAQGAAGAADTLGWDPPGAGGCSRNRSAWWARRGCYPGLVRP